MTNLGDLGAGQGSWAHAVNDAGQVVGGSPISSGEHPNHAFRWQNGVMQDLGTLGGPVSYAFDIDSAGQAAGYAWNADSVQHAVLWSSGGTVDLGDLDTLWPNHSAAYGINEHGQVVGGSYTDVPGEFHAFLWQNGSMQDLGTLGGGYSSAEAISKNGGVVGASRLSDDTTLRAFLWDGSMQDLGALGWGGSIAYDINDAGQVVGTLQTGQLSHAFLWTNGKMEDLNSLIPADSGWVLSEARDINNKGKIVGFGVINGQTHAYLLTSTATFRSAGAHDGWILESTETSGVGGTMNFGAATFNVGDGRADRQSRAILSFNTASIPDTAVITMVTLKVKRRAVVGTDPFTILGTLRVDIRKPHFGGRAALEVGDFQATASKDNIGILPSAAVDGWHSKTWKTGALFSRALFSHINLAGTTQLRLRFALDDDDDGSADYVSFFSGNSALPGIRPTLIIEYYLP